MAIFCNREIVDALKSIRFPKSKKAILKLIDSNISEASMIALNKLENKIYYSNDEICENIKIVCDLEIRNALMEMEFPLTKNDHKPFTDQDYDKLNRILKNELLSAPLGNVNSGDRPHPLYPLLISSMLCQTLPSNHSLTKESPERKSAVFRA